MNHEPPPRVLWTVWRFRGLRGEAVTTVKRAEPLDLMTQHTFQEVLGQAWAPGPKEALRAVTGDHR